MVSTKEIADLLNEAAAIIEYLADFAADHGHAYMSADTWLSKFKEIKEENLWMKL